MQWVLAIAAVFEKGNLWGIYYTMLSFKIWYIWERGEDITQRKQPAQRGKSWPAL
jgi:hypothetical protein